LRNVHILVWTVMSENVKLVPRYCRGRMIWMMKPTRSLLRERRMRVMMWANSIKLHTPILHLREKVLKTPKACGGSSPFWGNSYYIWSWKRVFHISNKSRCKIDQADDDDDDYDYDVNFCKVYLWCSDCVCF